MNIFLESNKIECAVCNTDLEPLSTKANKSHVASTHTESRDEAMQPTYIAINFSLRFLSQFLKIYRWIKQLVVPYTLYFSITISQLGHVGSARGVRASGKHEFNFNISAIFNVYNFCTNSIYIIIQLAIVVSLNHCWQLYMEFKFGYHRRADRRTQWRLG